MSHSPYVSRHLSISPLTKPPVRLSRVIEHSPSRLTTIKRPCITPVPVIEEHRTSLVGSPAIASLRFGEDFSPSVKISRSVHVVEERPALVTPIERPLLRPRPVIEEITPIAIPAVKRHCVREVLPVEEVRVVRGRSVEPIHRGVLSNKVPITFGQAGVTVHPIPLASLEGEEKVGLYSEVERLSLLNLELKKQLDMMYTDLEDQRVMASRVPDLEAGIHGLQKEVLLKDQDLTHVVREHELLRIDHEHLSHLGPAYNELLEHNKTLISEIDLLNSRLAGILHERDVLEIQAESVRLLQPKLEDATNRIDIMAQEILLKDEEIADCRVKMQGLMAKLEAMILENEQIHNRSVDYIKEKDMLLVRIEEMEKAHEAQLINLRIEMEAANKTIVEHERVQITEKYAAEAAIKDEQLAQVQTLIHSFESKMMILANEVEHLEKINLSKASEIDALKMRIALVEEEKLEAIKISETELAIKMDRQLAQQRAQYEGAILELKKELGEAERGKILLQQKDNEIELWKTQIENNERVWEMRLQKAVDHEVKSACNKYVLEMTAIETEASMNKDTIIKLENQINFLTTELERMTYSQNQRIVEMNELQRKLTSQEMTFKLSTEEQRTKAEIEKKRNLEDLKKELERVYMERIEEMRRFQASLEERLIVLADENTKLSGLVEDRTKDADNYSVKIRVMEDVYKQQVDEIHKKSSFSQKLAVEKEVSSATLKHKSERSELETKVAQYNIDLERLRTQYQLQASELERLTQNIENKDLELQQEKRRYVELEIQRTRDISELREQFDSYKRANIDVNTLQVRFEAERASLNSQIMQHKERASELEKRLSLLFGETDKVKGLYADKAGELEIMRQKHREEEERWHNERINLENENEYLKRAHLDGKESSIKAASEKTQYENQIRQLKTINENGKQELEKLYELMNQRKQEHDYYIRQNDELKKETDRLNRQLRDVGSETSTKKGKYEEFERNIRELERDRDLYKEHNERLNTQLKQTHEELEEKIKEIDATKKKYDESITKLSTQLDKDLMKKMMGSSILNSSPGKKERSSVSGLDF